MLRVQYNRGADCQAFSFVVTIALPTPPLTALAPMQDVTDLMFMTQIGRYGAPDYYFTEYFRVYAGSRLDRRILRSIVENPTGRPVFAQLIGESIPDLVRTARELANYPIAGIDLNLGCPAPRVYRKHVGGGLLRDPEKVEAIFAALRAAIALPFTVKMRIGFHTTDTYDRILDLVNCYSIDLLTVHGRTVQGGYRTPVRYDLIRHAVARARCPVLANGDVTSAAKAAIVLQATGAAGVSIGRSAIRNPWIFGQIRAHLAGEPISVPTLADVHGYIETLFALTQREGSPEKTHIDSLKKFLNFIGQSVDREGAFLAEIRRAQTAKAFWQACDRHLLADPDRPFALEPYPHLIARPSCEAPLPAEAGMQLIGGL